MNWAPHPRERNDSDHSSEDLARGSGRAGHDPRGLVSGPGRTAGAAGCEEGGAAEEREREREREGRDPAQGLRRDPGHRPRLGHAGRGGYDFAAGLSLALEVFNLFNETASDIDYFYESRLPGEPAPVADVHFHPAEKRSARLVAQWKF